MTEKFYKKIKLIQDVSFELPMSRFDFVTRLSDITEQNGVALFEPFSTNKKIFSGWVSDLGFEIRTKRKIFDFSQSYYSKFAGNIVPEGENKILITGKISAPTITITLILIFLVLVYCLIALAVIQSENSGMAIPFMIIHGLFMLTIFYLVFRRSVNVSKHFMERELFYLTKNNPF